MGLLDLLDELSLIMKKSRDFQKTGYKTAYRRFIELLKRTESSEFCDVSDSFNFSQTIRISYNKV